MNDIEIILRYFPDLNAGQRQQLSYYHDLLREWNAKINLVSRKDTDELFTRHILHSLSIASFFSFGAGTRIMDGGTGGGLPGIPLAIIFPEADFLLVDSIGKKTMAVREMTREMNLKNTRIKRGRIEEIKGEFDYIITRAVTRLKTFLSWTWQKVGERDRPGQRCGVISLKGGDILEEINEINQKVEVLELKELFDLPFFETKKIVFVPKNIEKTHKDLINALI